MKHTIVALVLALGAPHAFAQSAEGQDQGNTGANAGAADTGASAGANMNAGGASAGVNAGEKPNPSTGAYENPSTEPSASVHANANPSAGANANVNAGANKEENKTATTEAQNKVASEDILFDTSSADLKPDAQSKLKDLADWARCNPKGALILEGHADPRGTQEYNMELSARRAASVRQKLADMGVPSAHIVISVYGKNGPRRATFKEDRRVSIRAAETPVEASDITAMK
jgi:outer membrane protein OmpA-like peptidoglycan-associated protein